MLSAIELNAACVKAFASSGTIRASLPSASLATCELTWLRGLSKNDTSPRRSLNPSRLWPSVVCRTMIRGFSPRREDWLTTLAVISGRRSRSRSRSLRNRARSRRS